MSSGKKKRMSMLDNLAGAGAPVQPAGSMMSSNRALRSARDAVDQHHVWELDPRDVIDDRIEDRLDKQDVRDLQDAIETNGQTVPILVRRHPTENDRYLLVYGRRRLEAIKRSDKITKVRALVASLDDNAALQAQISENMARRDLSYIEKALFAQELVSTGFGNQSQVADVLTVTKSSISMAIAVVDQVGADVIRAIGAAHGIGRPKWEALGKGIEESKADRADLIRIAEDVYTRASVAAVSGGDDDPVDVSQAAFHAVEAAVRRAGRAGATGGRLKGDRPASRKQSLSAGGAEIGSVRRTKTGISIALGGSGFADWVEREAQQLIQELHGRWQQRSED